MRQTLKITLLTTAVALAAGCASNNITSEQFEQLQADVQSTKAVAEEARAAALQANDNAMQAKMMAQQTDQKLNRVFYKSQLK